MSTSLMACLLFASFNLKCTVSPILLFPLPLSPLYLCKFVLPEYNFIWPMVQPPSDYGSPTTHFQEELFKLLNSSSN